MTVLLVVCVISVSVRAQLSRIRIADDHHGFVEVDSGKPFIPWGFNYDRDYKMRLLEEYWATEWPTVEGDFREMKDLGANVVRVHLQFGRFMESADRPNEKSLAQLTKLVKLCEELQIRLDVTGLASYRHSDVPKWYDDLDEQHRWDAQANFWEAIAKSCANSPAVMFYDLINEPLVPDGKVGAWMTGHLEAFDYCQYITRDSAGRNRDEVSKQWTRKMVAAIRKHDPHRLISIGLLPHDMEKHGEGGFSAKAMAPELDFLCTHLYPESKKLDESLRILKQFELGKPVIIEEMYPIACNSDELVEFIQKTHGHASGWISFYWGQTPEELASTKKVPDAILRSWLLRFSQTMSAQTAPINTDRASSTPSAR
jgi:hypothetical protein